MRAQPIDSLAIIIGAMKAGTTSVHRYLDLHPQIQMSRTKELNFFVEEKNWHKGLRWYRRQLPSGPGVRGERSVNYSKRTLFGGVPERIRSVVARPRIIYLVRDPVRRLVAHWTHNYSDGRETRSLAEVVAEPRDNHYVDASRYFFQLEPYLRCFPHDDLLVVSLEELHRDPAGVMRRVFRFLEVDEEFVHPDFGVVEHASASKGAPSGLGLRLRGLPYGRPLRHTVGKLFDRPLERPALAEPDRARLEDVFARDVEQLRSWTGDAFSDWSL